MDNTNTPTNKENLIPKLKTPEIFYAVAGIIILLIIGMFMIFFIAMEIILHWVF